jgi:hypothetical protein
VLVHGADEILAAKTLEDAEERARAVQGDMKQELEALIKEARAAVRNVPAAVADALPYELRGEDMPWPDAGSYDHADVRLRGSGAFVNGRS